jgi:hypothetical protein
VGVAKTLSDSTVTTPKTSDPGIARKCFRCHQWGHVRIGSTPDCRWPESDPENGGEGELGETFPLKQGGTDGGETEGKERRRGGTREEWDEWDEWDEWVDGNDGEGENVCDIPGDECGNQGWVPGDKNCDEGSHDRCGEKVSAIGDEDMDDERDDEFGKRVAIQVAPQGSVVVANVDPVCWSIWLEWMTFWAGSGTDFEEGGEANAADGHSLDVAGREKIGITLWRILFPGFEVRVMRTLPSRILLGREFVLRHNMELGLGRVLGSFEVEAKYGRARFNGSIRYGQCDRVKISRSDGYRPLKLSSVCDCTIEEDGESLRHDHPRE